MKGAVRRASVTGRQVLTPDDYIVFLNNSKKDQCSYQLDVDTPLSIN